MSDPLLRNLRDPGSGTDATLLRVCWQAADEIERLRAALLKERYTLANDAAKYRWALNNSSWIRGEHAAYVAIPVAREADLSCVAMRDAAIDEAMPAEKGE